MLEETLKIRKIFDRNVGYLNVADPRSQVGGVVVKLDRPINHKIGTDAIRYNCHLDGNCPAVANGIYCRALTFLFSCRGLVSWRGNQIACGKAPQLQPVIQQLNIPDKI